MSKNEIFRSQVTHVWHEIGRTCHVYTKATTHLDTRPMLTMLEVAIKARGAMQQYGHAVRGKGGGGCTNGNGLKRKRPAERERERER